VIPWLIPPPVQAAPAPLPLEEATLDFCRRVASQIGWEAPLDPARLKALRLQAASMLPVCAKGLPPGSRALPLLEAALGALESAVGEEAKGEKRFGRAAKSLALRWRSAQKAWGAGSPRRLPELDNLMLLYELGGLRASGWRDEALRIRLGATRAPDPVLEKDLAAAVEDHYGPWLTVVEVEPMLEFCNHLARLWSGYRDDRALTRQIIQLGLKPNAERVWVLAARRSPEGFRTGLVDLLGRLDSDTLLSEGAPPAGNGDAALRLAEALGGTPLEPAARDLLKRLEARLSELKRDPRGELRRRMARIRGDWGALAGLLTGGLGEAKSMEEVAPLLGEAETLLRDHPDGGLLAAGTQRLKASALAGAGGRDLPQRLEVWAELQRVAGHPEEVEELLRIRLALEDPKGQDLPARCELLARLGRWKELEALLPTVPEPESERVLGWRFRAALSRGDSSEAYQWLEAWLARATGPEAPEEPPLLPGLCTAIPQLRARGEVLEQLAGRYGARLLPGQETLLAREPWRILAALDPEAPASLLPARAEEGLRWRWSRLPGGEPRKRLLERLIEDAEAQLGASHLLVAELLIDLGGSQKEEGREALERAQGILESSEGHEELLAKVYLALAAVCSQTDGAGLERNLLKAMAVLEHTPRLSEEAEDWMRDMPGLLLLHLWREQRLEELVALGPRVEALSRRATRPSPVAADLGTSLAALARVARFQSQLRAAGLP